MVDFISINRSVKVKPAIVVPTYDKLDDYLFCATEAGHERHVDIVEDGTILYFLDSLSRLLVDVIPLF